MLESIVARVREWESTVLYVRVCKAPGFMSQKDTGSCDAYIQDLRMFIVISHGICRNIQTITCMLILSSFPSCCLANYLVNGLHSYKLTYEWITLFIYFVSWWMLIIYHLETDEEQLMQLTSH